MYADCRQKKKKKNSSERKKRREKKKEREGKTKHDICWTKEQSHLSSSPWILRVFFFFFFFCQWTMKCLSWLLSCAKKEEESRSQTNGERGKKRKKTRFHLHIFSACYQYSEVMRNVAWTFSNITRLRNVVFLLLFLQSNDKLHHQISQFTFCYFFPSLFFSLSLSWKSLISHISDGNSFAQNLIFSLSWMLNWLRIVLQVNVDHHVDLIRQISWTIWTCSRTIRRMDIHRTILCSIQFK